MRSTVLSIVVATMVAALAASAHAQPADQQQSAAAMTHWEAGVKLFQKKRYSQASAEFAQGYAVSHKAGFLFNMAECARLLGDKNQAHDLYRRYLIQHPHGKLRSEALERCQALALGPCEAASAPAGPAAPVVPAKSSQVSEPDQPRPSVPPAALPPASAPDLPPTTASRPFYKRWPFWVAVGAVVVAGGVTAGVLASQSGGKSIPEGGLTVDFTNSK
jgi:hypothetical protein